MTQTIQRTSPLPIVAFIMAIAGWTLLPFFGCIVALLCAHAARREAACNPGIAADGGLTTAARIIGWAGVITALGFGLLIVVAARLIGP